MILDLIQLEALLADHGIQPWYSHSGRFDFMSGQQVYRRCWLVDEDPCIRPDLREACRYTEDLDDMAALVAAYLGTLSLGPWYLVPHVHWEHELLDHCPTVWRDVFALTRQREDDPLLSGANAVIIDPVQVAWRRLIMTLLHGLTQADALLLVDAPLILKVHHHQQVWLSTTDLALLPV